MKITRSDLRKMIIKEMSSSVSTRGIEPDVIVDLSEKALEEYTCFLKQTGISGKTNGIYRATRQLFFAREYFGFQGSDETVIETARQIVEKLIEEGYISYSRMSTRIMSFLYSHGECEEHYDNFGKFDDERDRERERARDSRDTDGDGHVDWDEIT